MFKINDLLNIIDENKETLGSGLYKKLLDELQKLYIFNNKVKIIVKRYVIEIVNKKFDDEFIIAPVELFKDFVIIDHDKCEECGDCLYCSIKNKENFTYYDHNKNYKLKIILDREFEEDYKEIELHGFENVVLNYEQITSKYMFKLLD